MSKNFLKARKIVDKRVRYQCHLSTLILYRRCDVPKGLRIYVKAATPDMSQELKARWALCIHEASKELLNIVIDHDNSQLEHILSEERKLTNQVDLTPHGINLLKVFAENKERQVILTKQKNFPS